VKRPRTLVIIMWRALKPTVVWFGSIVQVVLMEASSLL
jgi:hypothetical protein